MEPKQSSSPLTVLRHRNFATFWGAAVVSDIGTWMQAITVGVLVARITGEASATGLIGVAAFATQGFGSPVGGVLADRFDRRRMMMAALTGQVVVTIVLALVLAQDNPRIGLLTALVALQGLTGSLGQPAGQAIMPSLVPRDELLKAVSLQTMAWNSGRIIGSGLAAVLGIWLSPAWIVFGNAVSFAVLALAIRSVKGSFRAPHVDDRGSFARQFRVGARTLWETPGCRFSVVSLVFMQSTLIGWVGLIPIFAQEQLHGGRGLAGAVTMVQGCGAIFGAVTTAFLVSHVGRPRTVVLASCIAIGALLAYSQAKNRWVAFPFAFLLGMTVIQLFVCLGAVLQRDAPEHARARILSIQQSVVGFSFGLGVMVTARIADRFGLGPALAGDAVAFAVVLLVGVGPLRRHWAVLGAGDPPSTRRTRSVAKAGRLRPPHA